jgi:hypothetical protein
MNFAITRLPFFSGCKRTTLFLFHNDFFNLFFIPFFYAFFIGLFSISYTLLFFQLFDINLKYDFEL